MKVTAAKLYLPLIVAIALSIAVYINFQNYRPKILTRIQEIKGYKTYSIGLPYPQNSEKIAYIETSESKQITFRTTRTLRDVHDFYKNVLFNNGWEVESETDDSTHILTKYKKDKEYTTVLAVEQEPGITIASVEITER